ncbi:MAG TPA: hypothetical protein VL742_14105 [Casimicrobiaceae bacterium]|nr:hypothetical protein [Casimicrobiaceae bacterium]
MGAKKAFLLRLDPAVWNEVARLARAELRSVNAQIEYLLRDALARDAGPERRRDSRRPRRSGEQ